MREQFDNVDAEDRWEETHDDDEDEEEGEEEEEGDEEEEEEEDGEEEEEEEEEDEEEEEEKEEEEDDDDEEEEDEAEDDREGEAAPNFDGESSDDEPLHAGRDAEDIARDRLEKRIFEKADMEAQNEAVAADLDPEGLGEDFESTMWCPPTIKGAYEAMHKRVLHHGEASIWGTNLCTDSDLSVAAALYFQYMKTMATCMAWMTILALPAIIFSFFGKRTPEISKDGVGLYMFTLGNVGYDKTSETYDVDSACSTKEPAITNGTCIHVGPYLELDAYYGANILAATEFVQVVVFLFFVWKLDRKRKRLMRESEAEETTIKDYSIMVKNIPTDIRPENLLAHFHNLYKLNEADSGGRLRVAGAKTIQNLEHAQQEMYRGTWVSDICVHKRIGKYIKAFKDKGHIMEGLRRARAKMKMYAENTPHAHGPNAAAFAAAEQEMFELGTKIDQMSGHVFEKNFKLLDDYLPTGHADHHVHEAKLLEKVDAPAVCAFVTFNYCESAARAIEDYSYYGAFPRNLLFPSRLKLRGHVVDVVVPPEPDEIVWENLEVGKIDAFLHQTFTNIVAIVFTVVIFIIVVQAAIYKMAVSSEIPDMSLCNSHIPAAYADGVTLSDPAATVTFLRATEGSPDTAADLNKACADVVSTIDPTRNTFYAMFTEGGDWAKPVGNYDPLFCLNDAGSALNQCPMAGSTDFCPCFDVTSEEKCFDPDCSAAEVAAGESSSLECHVWTAGQMGSCSCVSELTTMLEELSVTEAVDEINSLGGSVCAEFFQAYAATTGLTYGISLATVVVNITLKAVLRVMCRWEKHTDLSEEQASYLFKVFLAMYFCFTFVALIAYGNIEGMPATLKAFYIFQGPYDDFTADWYAEVGLFMTISFIITGLVELVKAYLEYYVVYPLKRWWHFPSIERQSNTRYAMQRDVDALLVGPIFEPSKNLGIMLALLFMGMTVAPGLPLFMPFTAILYTLTFRKDKILLLRHNEKPIHASDATMKAVIYLLPWAAIIRLCFGIWMLGNEDLLETTEYSASDAGDASAAGVSTGDASSSGARDSILANLPDAEADSILYVAVTRAMRPNCLPLFVLLCIILLFKLISTFWKLLPVYWLFAILKFIKNCLCRKKVKIVVTDADHVESSKTEDFENNDGSPFITEFELFSLNHELRQEQCAFTGDYYSFLYDKHFPPKAGYCCGREPKGEDDYLSAQEYAEGWVTKTKFDRYVVKEKLWQRTTTFGGIIRRKGDPMRTYEIMDEGGCSSYELDQVPAYKLAMQALEEGMILAADEGTHDAALVEKVRAKNRGVLEGYKTQKVSRKVEKAQREDWEVDEDEMNKDYQRMVARKEKKASAELNEAVGSSYLSHHDDDDSGGSEEEEGDEGGGGGFDFL